MCATRVWEPSIAPLFLIAGGSGIVPLMAMLRARAAAGDAVRTSAPATLLYSSRSLDDVIYRNEVVELGMSDPTLRVVQTLTRAQPPGWTGFSRRIDADMLTEVGPAPALAPHIYICGPSALVESAANILVELGHDPARVKTERFGPTG